MLRASQILSPVPSCSGSVFAMLRLTAMLTTADFSLSAQVCSMLERGAEPGADRGNVTEEVRQCPPIHYHVFSDSTAGSDSTLARQSVGEERIEWDIIVCVCRELHYGMMVE